MVLNVIWREKWHFKWKW